MSVECSVEGCGRAASRELPLMARYLDDGSVVQKEVKVPLCNPHYDSILEQERLKLAAS